MGTQKPMARPAQSRRRSNHHLRQRGNAGCHWLPIFGPVTRQRRQSFPLGEKLISNPALRKRTRAKSRVGVGVSLNLHELFDRASVPSSIHVGSDEARHDPIQLAGAFLQPFVPQVIAVAVPIWDSQSASRLPRNINTSQYFQTRSVARLAYLRVAKKFGILRPSPKRAKRSVTG